MQLEKDTEEAEENTDTPRPLTWFSFYFSRKKSAVYVPPSPFSFAPFRCLVLGAASSSGRRALMGAEGSNHKALLGAGRAAH